MFIFEKVGHSKFVEMHGDTSDFVEPQQKLVVSSLRVTYNLVIIFNMYPPFFFLNITMLWWFELMVINVVFKFGPVELMVGL
jgi:hypothetical protein